jgi:amino acid adenylation domain-containing protein
MSRVESFLEESARRFPEKVALVVGKERVTYAELDGLAEATAALLRGNGVRRGDRVVLFLQNSVETVAGLFGAWKAGAVVCPIHPTTKADKLAFMLNNCQARAVLTQQRLLSEAERAIAQSPSVEFFHVVDREVNLSPLAPLPEAGRGEERPDSGSPSPRRGGGRGEGSIPQAGLDLDLALLIYTSGSTGFPKGVMMAHENVDAAATSIASYLENTSDDVVLSVLPLSYGYGLYQVLVGFKVGATVILESSFAFPHVILETMKRERVTGFPLVPTIAAILLQMKNLAPGDLPTLRYITNAAAALPTAHLQRLRELFPATRIFSMYGQTECTRVCYLPPEQLSARIDSVGVAIPNTEVWIVDENGERVGPGVIGELVVRGPHVMKGYWGDLERTAERLRPGPYPWEQVLYTGDLFKTDEDGYLYFVGRKDDIIKSRGEKVSPKEIENVLYALDGIQEAAVVGTPDPIFGMAIKAVIVLAEGSKLTEKEILRHCAQRLEDLMIPKSIEFRTSLPKTDSGKIRRSEVQAEELRKAAEARPTTNDRTTAPSAAVPPTTDEGRRKAEPVGAGR